MTEKAKRLAPTLETVRKLFLLSGNICAFPGCGRLMMNQDGVFVGQLCHIEAAEENGERFNKKTTNEQRRHASNLMLMCYDHHVMTNDIATYPVHKLKKMKADHERRFSSPDRVILETLKDWTEADAPTTVNNLARINKVLKWGNGPYHLAEIAAELNAYLAKLRNVPIDLRRFVGAVGKRIIKMNSTNVVRDEMSSTSILVSDLRGAFKLSDKRIADRANELDAYGIADIGEIETDMGLRHTVRIKKLKCGWALWPDIVAFCEADGVALEVFTDDLDFARLDD